MCVATYYTFRVENVTQRLEGQQAERAKTIDKLKAATKYNSTQELLEKYGGAPPEPKKEPSSASTPTKSPKNAQKPPQGRTSMGPPPLTANIGRPNQIPCQPSTPLSLSTSSTNMNSPPSASSPQVLQAQEDFAPNAFSAPPQYATGSELNMEGHWYDRVLDLLLGEDETSPKNRIVLICQYCRLVNGQAPPGTKNLAELGKWKCLGCRETNGEDDEAVKAVQEIKEMMYTQEDDSATELEKKGIKQDDNPDTGGGADVVNDDDNKEGTDDDSQGDMIEVSKAKRGRPKGSKNKT